MLDICTRTRLYLMKIKSAEFIISNTDLEKCPKTELPEYAFIGRSNVGKSSLINFITGRTHLAKTSSKPGKTQLINHFLINKDWYLVDLPGYGWAQVSKTMKEKWNIMIKDYMRSRKNLYNVFVLVDSRIEPQKIDLDFIAWLGEQGIALGIIFTKADRPRHKSTTGNIRAFKEELKKIWEELPPTFVCSAAKKVGGDDILNFIDKVNGS